jgi:hypothetical protein
LRKVEERTAEVTGNRVEIARRKAARDLGLSRDEVSRFNLAK